MSDIENSTEQLNNSCDKYASDTNMQEQEANVLSKTSVSKGEVLLTSIPFAYVLKGSLRGLHCDSCLRKRQGAQRCSGCASAYYCNRECQKNSWGVHKKECPKLKKLKTNLPPDTARLMARVIFRLQDDGNEFEEKINEKRSRKFKDLMNHYSDVKEDSCRQEHFTSLLVVLNKYLGEENLPDSAELLGIYGRVLVNSFSITDKDLNVVGVGVYLAASIIDHSCNPNAFASFIGTQIYIRALYDMTELDWNKIRISYIDVLNTTKERNDELEKGYFFSCDCPHCHDERREKYTSTIRCGNLDCSSPIFINETDSIEDAVPNCLACGFSDFESSTRQRYQEVLELTRTKILEMGDKNYLDTCKFLAEQQAGLFHELNVWRVKTLDATFESAIGVASWDVALCYGCENLKGMKFYYGSNHPLFGMCLLKLGKIELYQFKFQEALDHLEEAEPILRVSHGTEHPLCADELSPLLRQARQEIKMMQYSGFNIKKFSKNEIKGVLG